MTKFNQLKAAQLKSLPPGKHCDGQGLWLVKRADGGAQWVLRFALNGRAREMALGSLRTTSLADARERADAARRQVQRGEDPVRAKRRMRQEWREGRLESVADAAYAAHSSTLKRAENGKWFSPLRVHLLPRLGRMPVTQIDQHDIYDALAPIWAEKHETARKALSRLKVVFAHAIAMGFKVDMEVIEHARRLLGQVQRKPAHIEAMPWAEVPAFYASLCEDRPADLALRMLILTGVRSDAVRHMRFEQVEGDVWTIPADHVKARLVHGQPFRVPLSPEALRVIAAARAVARNGFLFANAKGAALDVMAMRNLMAGRGLSARPHGFRTSLRTWLSDRTDCEREVAEACLQHLAKSEVEKAYNRTDLLEKRRPHMNAWSAYVTAATTAIRNAA